MRDQNISTLAYSGKSGQHLEMRDIQLAFEQCLNRLANSLGRHSTRDIVVSAFGRDYVVPIREGGGKRPIPEKELVAIVHRVNHFSIRALLPPTGVFANLGVKASFGSTRGGFEAEVEVERGNITTKSVYGNHIRGKRLERFDVSRKLTETEMTLAELATELRHHNYPGARGELLTIELDLADQPSEVASVRRPVAPNFIDSLISLRIRSATRASFTGMIPPNGDLWCYGMHWSLADPFGGRPCTAVFEKSFEGEWRRTRLLVFSNCARSDGAVSAATKEPENKVLLAWDASVENWIGTELLLPEALDELRSVPSYSQRHKQIGIQVGRDLYLARPTDSGAGWSVSDLAFQFSLCKLEEFCLLLPANVAGVASVFGLKVPPLPLRNVAARIKFRRESDETLSAKSIECFTYKSNSSEEIFKSDLSSPVLTIDLEHNHATSNLSLDAYLALLEVHHPSAESDSRGEICVGGKWYHISWETRGAGHATQLLGRKLREADEVCVRMMLTESNHLHILGLHSEFGSRDESGKVEVAFSRGKRDRETK